MTNYVVAFVGLSASGKSSIINSLVFRRVLQSGVCCTTTEVNSLDMIICDDDNNKFKVIDFPGDSEEITSERSLDHSSVITSNTSERSKDPSSVLAENDKKFNDIIYKHIETSSCNLIIWVSDVNNAFITTHEVNEYNNLKKHIKQIEEDTGRIYHLIIMLSKCDKLLSKTKVFGNSSELCSSAFRPDNSALLVSYEPILVKTNAPLSGRNLQTDNKKSYISRLYSATTQTSSTKVLSNQASDDEILDSDEDTYMFYLTEKVKINKVKQKFPNDDIMLFNAFGRSFHHTKSSETLKKFVSKSKPSNANINFSITKYITNYENLQKISHLNKFLQKFYQYSYGKLNLGNLLIYWLDLDEKEQHQHLMKLISAKELEFPLSDNFYLFQFVKHIDKLILNSSSIKYVNNFLIRFYDKILVENKLKFDQNLYKTYTTREIIDEFTSSFILLDNNLKYDIYYNLLTESSIDVDLVIEIINNIDRKGTGIYDIPLTKLFNEVINDEGFMKYYDRFSKIVLKLLSDHVSDVIQYIPCNTFYYNKSNLCNIFTQYLAYLDKLSINEHFILINKIQIVDCIKNNQIINCHFQNINKTDIIYSGLKIHLSRLRNNNDYDKIINSIWKKIYSNIQIPFDRGKMIYFSPICPTELLYSSDDYEIYDDCESERIG